MLLAPTVRAETTAPVPLHAPGPLVPVETAGSGLAPEAKVRVSIDERGRVDDVKVLSIEPSTEHDILFEEVLKETLESWRYAPQRRNGIPEPTQLEWLVRFPARPDEGSPRDSVEPGGALPGADAESRRSRILGLPLERRIELLNAQALRAVEHFAGPREQVSTDHFVVHTDAGTEVATGIASNLEAIFGAIHVDFLPDLQSYHADYKLQVFVYRSATSYQSFLSDMPQFEWSSGFYSPAGLIALHLQQGSQHDVLSLLLHEATHAFVDRRVLRSGVALPRWLGEGFADYVGNSKIHKGQLQPGKVRSGAFEMHGGRIVRIRTGTATSLEEAKRALRRGEGIGVAELLSASPETFYGDNRRLFYDTAWLFVHYLREGRPGWAEKEFPDLVLYLAEGYPAEVAFREIYGPIEAAEEEFRRYVKGF